MSGRVNIDGTDAAVLVSAPLSDVKTLNEIGQATFTTTINFIPGFKKNVYLYEDDDTTLRFGGLIITRALKGWAPVEKAFIVQVTCNSFLSLLNGFYVTLPAYTSTSVHDILVAFVAQLPGAYGITLSGGQATGPLVTIDAASNVKGTDFLRQLAAITTGLTGGNMVVRMSPAKVLDLFVPGGTPGPVAITEANTHAEAISWQDSTKPYATQVILSLANLPTSDGVVSAGVTQNDYVTTYPAYLGSDLTWPSLLIVNGINRGPVAFGTAATGWYWDAPNQRLVNTHAGGAYEPVASDVVTIAYNARAVISDSADTPLVQYLQDGSAFTTLPAAQAYADGLLHTLHRNPRILRVTTTVAGFDVGQALTVSLPTTRGISNGTTFNITTLTKSRSRETSYIYTFDAEENDTAAYITQGSALNDWRVMLGGSGGGAIAGGGGGGGGPTVVATWVNIGGSRTISVAPNPAAWVTVSDIGWIPQLTASYRVWVNLWSLHAGIGVTARLYDQTASAAVSPTSTEESGTTAQRTFFLASLTAGHIYVLQLKATSFTSPATTADGQSVYGTGYIEGV